MGLKGTIHGTYYQIGLTVCKAGALPAILSIIPECLHSECVCLCVYVCVRAHMHVCVSLYMSDTQQLFFVQGSLLVGLRVSYKSLEIEPGLL